MSDGAVSVSTEVDSQAYWGSAPKCLHIDGRFEHEENVSVIVGVDHLAICAKILGAESTAVPLADDVLHMAVAERKIMWKVTKKISYSNADEQLPLLDMSE